MTTVKETAASPVRFAYFVPEFPGATHTFFHRELTALRAMGADPHVVSTRPPSAARVCHSWAASRTAETTYLWPFKPAHAAVAASVVGRAGPSRLFECARATAFASGLGGKERIVNAGLVLPAINLVAWMRANDLHHVHAHFASSVATIAMLAHVLSGVSYSISAHGDLWLVGGNQPNKWRHAAFGIAITDILRRAIRKELGDAAPQTIEVAPMGVEVARLKRRAPYVPYSGSGPLRIFSCGRLTPDKGHEFMIRAVGKLVKAGVDVRLRVAGVDYVPGDLNKLALDALIAELGIAKHVELLGGVDEDGVREELEGAHMFALASIAEPLGVAYMEAMAMELPTIGTNAGGVTELMESGVNGILVPPRDADAVAAAITSLIADPEQCVRLGKAARARVVAKFQSTRSAELLVDLIGRFGKGSSRGHAGATSRAQNGQNGDGSKGDKESARA